MSCDCQFSVGWRTLSKNVMDGLGQVCCGYVFPLGVYCTTIGVLGVVLTTLDIYRVLADGAVLSDRVWTMRRPDAGGDQPISEQKERDVKLMTAVVEWTAYSCLIIGGFNCNPYFLMPWLLLRSLILMSFLVLFCMGLLQQQPMTVSTMGLLSGLLEIHNYLYVCCLFRQLLSGRRC
ncbi:uncharacterized protein LOC124361411 [Homalodisca vitripennis]|uniref:uncharacterized protein LOC124361411 n=1 Tax=Homalodisca vitripennis TaxID=197043 RepID=UPI001EEB33B8|nr:uncharacterized protein LOC124361411 [Homalodisca vitripennis]KAG8301398.1 hypothetical protein J6590_054319 [Homalodisca vitripennis]